MSSLHLKNTYTKSLERFEPIQPSVVTMYSCGPTVYSNPHIGNFRAFLLGDLLRRVLELEGYRVRHVMNLTDVGHMTEDHLADAAGEDKLSKAARELGSDPYTVADHYAKVFKSDAQSLRLKNYKGDEADDPSLHPRATRHIPEMLAMIQALLERGYAYVDSSGQVYFEIAKFPEYGRLSGKVVDELEAGARVSVRTEKKDPRDFALWKVDTKHLMQWDPHGGGGFSNDDRERLKVLLPRGVDSRVRPGFPGWHIECSAMSKAHLGETIDIHTGGEDNVFPHHECEIAQSYGVLDTFVSAPPDAPDAGQKRPTFARYWVHNRHLLVDGRKMAKREGTVFTIQDLIDEPEKKKARPELLDRFARAGISEGRVTGAVLRYALISNPYGQPMNFTFDLLVQAKASVDRLRSCYTRLRELCSTDGDPVDGDAPSSRVSDLDAEARRGFQEGLDDNLNMPKALAAVFGFVTRVNQIAVTGSEARRALATLEHFDAVLDVLQPDPIAGASKGTDSPSGSGEPTPRSPAGFVGREKLTSDSDSQPASDGGMQDDLSDEQIEAWLIRRQVARKSKDFKLADRIRQDFLARGIGIEDTPQGVRWKRSQ